MKKIIKKIESNKLLFSIFILFAFLLFIFITNGFNGAIISDWGGIAYYINDLSNTTVNGNQMFYEVIWAILLIPVLLIFKNKYIFSQKRMAFEERIKYVWPMLLVTISIGLMTFSLAGGIRYFNLKEIVAMIFLYSFVGIFEEFLCRGWLQNEFLERFGKDYKGVLFSIFLSGLIFGCIHIINFFAGADLINTIFQIISCIIAGIFFGSVYYKTKNIWTCVFLHGFWDLALSLSTMNDTISCASVDTVTLSTRLILPILMIFLNLPEILISLKILTKTSVNDALEKNKKELTKEQIENDEKKTRTINNITIVYSIILSVFFVFMALLTSGEEDDTCMSYENKEISNIEIMTLSYKDYSLKFDDVFDSSNCIEDEEDCLITRDYSVKFKIENDKFFVNSLYDHGSISLDLENVKEFGVYEKYNKYIVMVRNINNKNGNVYYSDYLNKERIINGLNLEEFKNSFKPLELPSICGIGFFGVESKEPLFKTCYESYYIMDGNDNIKKLEIINN